MAKTTPSKVKKTKKKKDKSAKKKKRKLDDDATAPKKKKLKVEKDGSAKKKKKKKLTKKGDGETPKKKKKKTKKVKTPDAAKSGKKKKAKKDKSSVKKKKKGKKANSAKKKKKKVVKEEEAAAPAPTSEEKAEEEEAPAAEAAPAPATPAATDADDGATVKLFVGNLSFDITEEIIKEFFKDCGTLTDVFWLEDKTDGRFLGKGFITFETVDQARLAYAKKDEEVMGRAIMIDYARPREKKGGGQRETRPLSERPEGCVTVFLGNLDFNIEDQDVKNFAKGCGEIRSIRWLTHRDTGDFKGCGFCEFTTPEGVDEFVKLNGKMLKGRAIRIDYAQKRSGGGGGGGGKREPRPLSEKPEGCTTVFVGNLSFDITEDVIHELAKDCGDGGVKHVRWLTDRETQEFKGCGFIEFHDTESVDKFVLKNGADVMGRSIRIDYAKPRAPRE